MIIQNYILDMINYFFVYWRDYNLFQIKKLWYSIYHFNYQIYKCTLPKTQILSILCQFFLCHLLRSAKRTNKDLQIITQKTKERTTRTPIKTGDELIGVRVVRSLVFCVIICRSLFVLLADLSKWHRKNWHYINWKKKTWSLLVKDEARYQEKYQFRQYETV
jgi:ABC-type Fe3+ transport system permease subunit